jgi:hypothetical protein
MPSVRYTSKLDFKRSTITCEKELVIDQWSVPADKAGDYARLTSKIHENTVFIRAVNDFGRPKPLTRFLRYRPLIFYVLWVALVWFVFFVLPQITINGSGHK